MEELFFAVKPVWWEGKIAPYELYIVLFLCIFFALIVRILRKPRKVGTEKKVSPSFPQILSYSPEDPEFALKTLDELKHVIGYFYTPEKTQAHTVHEIGSYLFDSKIIALASKLERSIYLGKPLEVSECSEINREIQLFIEKTRQDHM